jgi:hypothetical protein
MMLRKTIPLIAVALVVCAALLFQAVPVSAAETVVPETPEAALQAPPPPPYIPPVVPYPPPKPPVPPVQPHCIDCPPCPPSWDSYGCSHCDCSHCCESYNPYNCRDYCCNCCNCCDCCVETVVIVETCQPVVCNPVINSFIASPSCVHSCDDVILSWNTSNANTVTISPNIGSVSTSGSRTVRLCSTTTYTIIASNNSGSVSASTTVTVSPQVTVSTAGISSSISSSGTSGAGTGSILTMGIGGGDGPLSSTPLYAILLALLAVAAVAITVFLVKRRQVPVAAFNTATVAGYAPWFGGTATATEMPGTTPLDTGVARFVTADGRQIAIPGKGGVMGRNELRSFIDPDKTSQISRQHFRIYCEKGNYYIEDSSSVNGTRVNGSRITGKGRYLLNDGDVIDIADVLSLTFKE